MVDTVKSVSVTGTEIDGIPNPAEAIDTTKFVLSFWINSAALLPDKPDFTLRAIFRDDTDFVISFEMTTFPDAVFVGAQWTTLISLGNQAFIANNPPLSHDTGWANVLIAIDTIAETMSFAICYSDLGTSGDIAVSNGTFNNPFLQPFDPIIPFSSAEAGSGWRFEFGGGTDDTTLSWITLLLGTYYDLTDADNRRLFNTPCPGDETLTIVDTTSYNPVLLMHGDIDSFVINRADNQIWVASPDLENTPDVPECSAPIFVTPTIVGAVSPGPGGPAQFSGLGIRRRGTLNWKRSLEWGRERPWTGFDKGRGIGYTAISALPFRSLPGVRTTDV